MKSRMKTLLIGLVIFAALAAGIFVVYQVRQPATNDVPSPIPTPRVTPNPSPVVPQVFEVSDAKCSLSFTVAPELVPGLNCVSKEIYKDVTSNAAGRYTLTGNKLADTTELVPGTKYIYAINYKNTGTGATAGTVTDVLPAGIKYEDSTDGCTYAGTTRTVTCTIPSVAASGTGQHAIRFSVETGITATSITNTAKVTPTTGTESQCKVTSPIKTPTPSGSPAASPSVSPSPAVSPSPNKTANLDCIVKRAYADASSNKAGQYYLNEEIIDTKTLENGQTVVFNVLIGNTGEAAVSDVTITDVLSSNLTFIDAESGCTYNSDNRTVTCNVGSLAGSTQTSRSFRARINVAGTSAIANTADVTSTNGQRDSCSLTVNAAGKVVQPPSPVPTALPEAGVFEVTAGTLGVGLLLLLVGALGLLII